MIMTVGLTVFKTGHATERSRHNETDY